VKDIHQFLATCDFDVSWSTVRSKLLEFSVQFKRQPKDVISFTPWHQQSVAKFRQKYLQYTQDPEVVVAYTDESFCYQNSTQKKAWVLDGVISQYIHKGKGASVSIIGGGWRGGWLGEVNSWLTTNKKKSEYALFNNTIP